MALEEAETKIRETVQYEYFKQTSKTALNEKVKRIIQDAINKVKIPELKKVALQSLLNFYERQYAELKKITPLKVSFFIALSVLQGKVLQDDKRPFLTSIATKQQAYSFLESHGVKYVNLYGSALQKYSKDYIEKNIKPVVERLAKQFPLDPSDVSGRMSLRGKAEMEVRYQHNLDMVQGFRDAGHKLVICSTHADCSERCAEWQGRVYSLDGTSGVTDDGRKYVPLETATDIYYTTKKGKTYKNGLFGFGCRHFLVVYKSGYRFPKPNVQEERKQYSITLKQRQLEREVIKWKTEAVTYKFTDREKYLQAKQKAQEWNKRYIDYSKANDRAYYPSRTKII